MHITKNEQTKNTSEHIQSLNIVYQDKRNSVNPWLEYTRALLVAFSVDWGTTFTVYGDIVRVFFLFESRRGNGTKFFTSLKHNPVGKRVKTICLNLNNKVNPLVNCRNAHISCSNLHHCSKCTMNNSTKVI